MDKALEPARQEANRIRYRPGDASGHYESFFVRANHPKRPLAFWVRYTLYVPKGQPDKGQGELWAVYFNGVEGRFAVTKHACPLHRCSFAEDAFEVAIGDATINETRLHGAIAGAANRIAWDLTYQGDQPPLYLLPRSLYESRFPKAKSLVSLPMAVFNGSMTVDDAPVPIEDWVGSQNHNWGAKHTDHYAWGQVAGFDNAPDAFFEVATAKIKVGPIWPPPMTVLVFRQGDTEITINSIRQAIQASAVLDDFTWHFETSNPQVEIEGVSSARREAFVGLAYRNPPGGTKNCLNTKLAECELRIHDKTTGEETLLITRDRAAFEILTDRSDHGVEMRA